MKYLLFLIPLFLLSCNSVSDNFFSPEEVQKEAEQFMEGIIRDMMEYDKAAMVSKYSSEGYYRAFNGTNEFRAPEEINKQFPDSMPTPLPFWLKWRDLSYLVLSENAVVVNGDGIVGNAESTELVEVASTYLLTKENGEWKIRLEHESMDPFVSIEGMLDEGNPFRDTLLSRSIDPLLVKAAIEAMQ